MRLAVLSATCMGAGTTLLLGDKRWFRRRSLADRLLPYGPAGPAVRRRPSTLSVASLREVTAPVAHEIGNRIGGAFGVEEDLATRLERIDSSVGPTDFRLGQMARSAAAFGFGAALAATSRAPAPVGLLLILGPPLIVFLVIEQRLAAKSAEWQQAILLELPVVAEQLGMLLSAGFSLGAAINRLASRGSGRCARDLRRVTARVRHGMADVEALHEWAARARVDALDRLVAVLALNHEAGDLGRLVSNEARSIRREVHRGLIERVERRAQTVWIPVTVATLVPGALFLAVPFIEALRLVSR